MTVVRPELQFGVTELGRDGPGDGLPRRSRAPSTGSTAASSASSAAALEHLGPDSVLEREPLQRSRPPGELRAHRHEGFWECMDTYKDAVALNDLWAARRGALAAVGGGGGATRRDDERSRPR